VARLEKVKARQQEKDYQRMVKDVDHQVSKIVIGCG